MNELAEPFIIGVFRDSVDSPDVVYTAKTTGTDPFFDSPFGSPMRTDSKRK